MGEYSIPPVVGNFWRDNRILLYFCICIYVLCACYVKHIFKQKLITIQILQVMLLRKKSVLSKSSLIGWLKTVTVRSTKKGWLCDIDKRFTSPTFSLLTLVTSAYTDKPLIIEQIEMELQGDSCHLPNVPPKDASFFSCLSWVMLMAHT